MPCGCWMGRYSASIFCHFLLNVTNILEQKANDILKVTNANVAPVSLPVFTVFDIPKDLIFLLDNLGQ